MQLEDGSDPSRRKAQQHKDKLLNYDQTRSLYVNVCISVSTISYPLADTISLCHYVSKLPEKEMLCK